MRRQGFFSRRNALQAIRRKRHPIDLRGITASALPDRSAFCAHRGAGRNCLGAFFAEKSVLVPFSPPMVLFMPKPLFLHLHAHTGIFHVSRGFLGRPRRRKIRGGGRNNGEEAKWGKCDLSGVCPVTITFRGSNPRS